VRAAREYSDPTPEVIAKVKIALLDFLSCVYESRDLPASRHAIEVAGRGGGGPAETAFANAVLGHGLVREDMHTGSVSHLGIVIFPTLLALSQSRKVAGRDLIRGAVCGYEIGASVGRALMDQETVRIFRPTGITGPLGAAVAGSVMLGLSEDAGVSALGFAANATVGLNEWPSSGADDMFFHAGFAARNAVTSVELAELGAFASETALDGPAGLFAALRRSDRVEIVAPFSGDLEIFSVYHKPAPACNYAQTACQAALAVTLENGVGIDSREITAVQVMCSAAAINYPGCNAAGPFQRVLQAKMSIHFCVAATLARRSIEESNYRQLDDPEIGRLIGVTKLEEDPEFTQAYPGAQGSEVIVTLRSGKVLRKKMSDLIPARPDQIRARFRQSAGAAAQQIETMVDTLERLEDLGPLAAVFSRASRGGNA
jgi:2-methylcitrate dehydratase PrpD